MKTKQSYECEKCNQEFDSEYEAKSHEESCGITMKHTCDKCGKITEYDVLDRCDFRANEVWSFGAGRAGYGSGLDGCEVNFDLCDDCLIEFINGFTIEGREKVENSGSNQRLSSDQWIRMEKGEMSDEETEELGYYSQRQIKAYNENFPVCDKVKIIVYSDDSCGSMCNRGCFGDKLGNTGMNIGSECFQCKSFVDRGDSEIPVIKEEQ